MYTIVSSILLFLLGLIWNRSNGLNLIIKVVLIGVALGRFRGSDCGGLRRQAVNVPTEQEAREQALRSVDLAKLVLVVAEIAEKAHARAKDANDFDLIGRTEVCLVKLVAKAQMLHDRALFYTSFYDASQES